MLFIVFFFLIFQRVIDLTDQTNSRLIIYFKPFDVVEVKLNRSVWTIFSDWNDIDDLHLDVTTYDPKNKIIEFGPFDSSSRLIGLIFRTSNYTLKFTSESTEEQKFALLFSLNINDAAEFPIGFVFPFFYRYQTSYDLNNIPEYPFYYDVNSKEEYIAYYVFAGFAFLYLFTTTLFCRKQIAFSAWDIIRARRED